MCDEELIRCDVEATSRLQTWRPKLPFRRNCACDQSLMREFEYPKKCSCNGISQRLIFSDIVTY